MSLGVELIELLGPDDREGQRFPCELRMSPTGARCQIGQSPDVELVLPRKNYPDLAQRHIGVLFPPNGGVRVETYQRHLSSTIDGKVIDGSSIEPGEHLLVLGAHRFKMIIRV